jgi:hypothetical protein
VSDGDLFERLLSGQASALASVYDRHAASVYGLVLLRSRSRASARRVLLRTFAELARSPERASTSAGLGGALLAIARTLSREERTPRWRRSRPEAAFEPGAEAGFLDALGKLPAEEAEEFALRKLEGMGIQDLEAARPAPPSPQGGPPARWKRPPGSMRPLTLLRAVEAARPARRYVRWVAEWVLFAGAVLLAWTIESRAPEFPLPRPAPVPPGAEWLFRTAPGAPARAQDLIDVLRDEGSPR